jgi:hypothetical protein
MSEFTDYTENELLDHLLGKGTRDFTSPASLYLALLTATASDSTDLENQLTEPTTGGYAKKAIAFDAASGGSAASSAAYTWTNTGATAWTVVGIAILDGTGTSANVLAFDNDMADATINQTEKLQFSAGDITVALD